MDVSSIFIKVSSVRKISLVYRLSTSYSPLVYWPALGRYLSADSTFGRNPYMDICGNNYVATISIPSDSVNFVDYKSTILSDSNKFD